MNIEVLLSCMHQKDASIIEKSNLTNDDAQVEIVNFRTDTQKDIYSVITRRKGIKYLIKNIYSVSSYRSFKAKHDKFEDFLQNKLGCNVECNTAAEINDKHFDVVIAGRIKNGNITYCVNKK